MNDVLVIALVAMVSVWTLVSIALGVLAVLMARRIDSWLKHVDAVLSIGQDVAEDVRAPVRAVAESVREVFAPSVRPAPPVDSGQPIPAA